MPTSWQGARVVGITDETARAKTFRLELSRPTRHRAGQHFVIRLTAPDGYTAARSYSVASPPDETGTIELTVERLDDLIPARAPVRKNLARTGTTRPRSRTRRRLRS